MFSSGEGAVSTGAMVPVYRARDAGNATRVVELLESHAIPAIVDSDIAGPHGLGEASTPRVLVPSTMLPAAKAVLQQHRPSEPTPLGQAEVSALLTWVPAKVTSTDLPGPTHEDELRPASVVEPEPDGPLEVPLPDPGPLGPRLTRALVAVAFGLGFQRLMELLLPGRGAVEAFGATADVLEAPWRLVTASFMHGSASHMISNAAFGVMIGVVLFGTHRVGATALVWLLSSMAGIGAELMMSPNAVVIGASAGNYGLVGLWAFGQLQRARGSALPRRERLRTIGVLLLLVPGAFTPFSATGSRIAVFAHGVGFAGGFLLGPLFERRLDFDRFARIARRSKWAGVLAGMGTVAAFSVALYSVFR